MASGEQLHHVRLWGSIKYEKSAYSSSECHQYDNSLIFQNFPIMIGWRDVLCSIRRLGPIS